jgi:hypothetical protein
LSQSKAKDQEEPFDEDEDDEDAAAASADSLRTLFSNSINAGSSSIGPFEVLHESAAAANGEDSKAGVDRRI